MRHHVAEHRAHRALQRTATAADIATTRLSPGRCARALTRFADNSGVHFKGLSNTEDDVFQIDIHANEGVLTAFLARTGPPLASALAKERLKDVPKRTKTAETSLATHVEIRALLRVGENVVSVGDKFEALLGVLRVIDIGVELPS